MREGAKTNSLEPSDQVVKVGDEWVGRFWVRAPCWLLGSQMSKCPTGYKQSHCKYCRSVVKTVACIIKLLQLS